MRPGLSFLLANYGSTVGAKTPQRREQAEPVEHDAKDQKEAAGITRSQQTFLTLPHDRASVGQFLEKPLERIDAALAEPQLLVLTADGEGTTLASGVAAHMAAERGLAVAPVTSPKRGARLIAERGAQVVIGAPVEVLSLIQSSTLKLAQLRGVVLAWVDETHGGPAAAALEAIMAEIPKDASRTLVISRASPEALELAERYVRRGLRGAEPPTEDDGPPVNLQYVPVAAGARSTTLRRLLDELDPARAAVWTRSPESRDEAARTLATLGYHGAESSVRVVESGTGVPLGDAGLVILYDVPASRAEIRAALGTAAAVPQVVVLAQPRQMPLVRSLAAGGRVGALTLAGPGADARQREESVRAELRGVLESGIPARELLALEPLLETHDGVEIAAAALRLLEQERAKRGRKVKVESSVEDADAIGVAPRGSGARPTPASGAAGVRIFITIGERDGVRAGDLVGAIAGTAGITGENIGRIELRDNHSLVEIVGEDAGRVAEKITGTSIKGRRVVARLERDRPPRPEGGRGFGGRDREERGDRPPRSGGDRPRFGSDRPRAPRGDRPDRADRPDRPRGDRPGGGPRGERPPRRRPEERGGA